MKNEITEKTYRLLMIIKNLDMPCVGEVAQLYYKDKSYKGYYVNKRNSALGGWIYKLQQKDLIHLTYIKITNKAEELLKEYEKANS